jgi:hypothetical protein
MTTEKKTKAMSSKNKVSFIYRFLPIVLLAIATHISLQLYGIDTGNTKEFVTFMVGLSCGVLSMLWLILCWYAETRKTKEEPKLSLKNIDFEVDHQGAYQVACMNKHKSNLARSYLSLHSKIFTRDTKTKKWVILG